MSPTSLIKTLKQALKAKGINYRDLASELSMSESGVKKMFQNTDLSLGRLHQIAELLEVPVTEIFRLAEEEEIKNVKLTTRQEEELLKDQNLFRVFWHLTVMERSIEEISKRENLTLEKLKSHLRKLENIDLIQITKRGKVKKLQPGLIRWNNDSPLVNKINREWSRATLEKVLQSLSEKDHFHRLSFLKLRPDSRQTFYDELDELLTKYVRLSGRQKIEKDAEHMNPLSLLIAISPSEFTL